MVATDARADSETPRGGALVAETSPRRAAQMAGVGYLVIFVLSIFANFFVRTSLVDSGDAAATATNIADAEPSTTPGSSGWRASEFISSCSDGSS